MGNRYILNPKTLVRLGLNNAYIGSLMKKKITLATFNRNSPTESFKLLLRDCILTRFQNIFSIPYLLYTPNLVITRYLKHSACYYYLSTFSSHQTQHVEKGQTIIHKCCCVQLLSSRCSKPLSRKHHGKNFRLSLFFCLKITSSHHHLTYISSAISQLLRASN